MYLILRTNNEMQTAESWNFPGCPFGVPEEEPMFCSQRSLWEFDSESCKCVQHGPALSLLQASPALCTTMVLSSPHRRGGGCLTEARRLRQTVVVNFTSVNLTDVLLLLAV